MPRRSTSACLLAVACAAVAIAAPPADAAAARTCSLIGRERALGPTYTTSLRVTGVSCRTGRRVVKSYYRCRVESGGKDGRCTRRVRGYACSERRFNVIDTQYDARVRCRKGSLRVGHDYTQFT
jgi:hypothetical protein